ncbi:hypothetical protein [Azospirillum brasilense]|uniref:Uncharacterized protein n=1 Tax=Azospirillum brasilense TaxID=192 RepID=A0A235H7X4_AZOBR|nr:hypothetical protein [Azospirillum brasilense]OYD81624.1 hypothetical protein CHT98_25165 [Azospirillum brasilense]
MAEHPLRAPGPGVADLFGQLPAVLALGAAEQPFQVLAGLPTRLGTRELTGNAAEQFIEPGWLYPTKK